MDQPQPRKFSLYEINQEPGNPERYDSVPRMDVVAPSPEAAIAAYRAMHPTHFVFAIIEYCCVDAFVGLTATADPAPFIPDVPNAA